MLANKPWTSTTGCGCAADGRHDPAAVAALAAEHACRLLDAEAAAVFEWDERQDLLVPVYESPSAAREGPMRRGEGMAGTVFQFLQPMNVADYQSLDIGLPASAQRGMRGALAVPMMVAGRRRGSGWTLAALLPCYLLMHAVAAWRGLLQLVRDPYGWEKTTHHEGAPNRLTTTAVPSRSWSTPRISTDMDAGR